MVSYQEALAQIQQQTRVAQQQVESQRRMLQEQRKQILSKAELRRTTYVSRQQALRQLSSSQQQLQQFQKQILTAEGKALERLRQARISAIRSAERRKQKWYEKWERVFAKRERQIETGRVLPVGYRDVMVDGRGYSVAPEFQEKFAKEQIEKYGATKVETRGFVYTATGDQVQYQTQFRTPKEQLVDYIKTQVMYQDEIERYKKLGYNPREAEKLAASSVAAGGVTYTPDYAVKGIIKPTRVEQFVAKLAKQVAEGPPPSLLRPEPVTRFVEQAIYEFIPKTKGQLLLTAATFGFGAALGGTVRVAAPYVKYISPKVLPTVGKAIGVTIGATWAIKKGEQIVYEPTTASRGFRFGEAAREAVAFGGGYYTGGFVARQIQKPVVIKEVPKEMEFVAKTKVWDIRQAEKQVQIAKYKIIGIKEPRYAFKAPTRRVGGILLTEKQLAKVPLPWLKILYPKGRVVKIEEPQLVRTITEPFIVKAGEIIRPTRRKGEFVGMITQRAVPRKVYPIVLSRLLGKIGEGRKVKLLFPEKLPPAVRKGYEELQILAKKPKVVGEVPKELEMFKGDITVIDVGKVKPTGEFIFFKKGRRIRRTGLTTVMRDIAKIEVTGKEFGVREIEYGVERIAGVDVTFPRMLKVKEVTKRFPSVKGKEISLIRIPKRVTAPAKLLQAGKERVKLVRYETKMVQEWKEVKPKRADLLKGIVERVEIEFPPPTEPTGIRRFVRPVTRQVTKQKLTFAGSQQALLATKAMQKAMAKPVKVPSATTVTELKAPAFKQVILKAERTEETMKVTEKPQEFFKDVSKEVVVPKEITKEQLKETPKEIMKEVMKEVTKEVSKLAPKELTKEAVKEMTKELTKTTTKEVQKELLKQVTKYVTKSPPKVPRFPPPTLIPRVPFKLPPEKKIKKIIKFLEGKEEVQAQIRRFGRWMDIGKPATLRKAREKAVSQVRKTLGAAFRLRKGEEILPIKRLPYGFRPAKREVGVVIERRRFRLDMPTEVTEIMAFKRRKSKKSGRFSLL